MKRTILLAILVPLLAFSQELPCNVDNFTPQWIAFPDYTQDFYRHTKAGSQHMKAYHFPAMKPHLKVALDWSMELAAGIKRSKEAKYQFEMLFGPGNPDELLTNAWYLATRRNGGYNLRIKLHDVVCRPYGVATADGPAEILVSFNSFHKLGENVTTIDDSGNQNPVIINGKPVFLVPERKNTGKYHDYYEFPGPVPDYVVNFSRWEFLDAFVLRHHDKPLFIPVTRKEFLEFFLASLNEKYNRERKSILENTIATPPEEIEKEREARIAEIKKFTEQGAFGYSASNLDHRIKTANDFFDNKRSEEDGKIMNLTRELDDNYSESVKLVKEYLAKSPPAVLQKPIRRVPAVFTDPPSVSRMLENLDDAPGQRMWGQNTEVCFINPDYFDNTLPNDVPQLIVIEFINNEYVHENLKILAKRILDGHDVSKLSVLLGN